MADEDAVDLSDDVAFQTPDDFSFAEAFFGASEDVGLGDFVVSRADQDDAMDGRISCTVPAAAEAVPVGLP